jgi:ubiquinone/menaquinone biosynthesis C-methylase UbiE
MKSNYSLEEIRKFWTQQAKEHGTAPAASWSDVYAIHLEIDTILKYLNNGEKVIDVGCANGYSTVQFASQKKIDIKGVDYIPEMIDQAKVRLSEIGPHLLGAVAFDVDDIMKLKELDNTYDKVIVIRVVINLESWKNQLAGLKECVRILKPGGQFLLSEATLQGWKKLNQFRAEWGLSEIPMPSFNNYLDQEKVIDGLSASCKCVGVINFSSTYFVGTRIIKPLINESLHNKINVAQPDMEWNRFWSMAPAWGDYGTQKLFVFEKK